MNYNEKKIIRHEFSFELKKVTGDTYLAFLRRIFDHKKDQFYNCMILINKKVFI